MGAGEKETNAGEGAQKDAIDLSKYVPKEELEKAQSSYKTDIEKMRGELDQAKLALLDPEYVAFLAEKKNVSKEIKSKEEELKDGDLTSKEIAALRKELNILRVYQQNVMAQLELQQVEKKYKDFNDYREDVAKILETSKTDLTIEQAYKLAKQNAADKKEKSEEEKEKSVKAKSEKPGSGAAPDGGETKTFKGKADAAEDAWDKIVGPGKDLL